ncbi:MAG: ankyrin repeat domain-containing protein [Pyrinomonadaceae bacterium]
MITNSIELARFGSRQTVGKQFWFVNIFLTQGRHMKYIINTALILLMVFYAQTHPTATLNSVSAQKEGSKTEDNGELFCPKEKAGDVAGTVKRDDLERTDEHGCTRMMRAAENGEVDTVRKLLESGAQVDAKLSSGETALILAAKEGHLEIVRLLVKRGGNVNAAVNGPHTGLATVLTYGIRSRNKQIIESLIEAGADVNPPQFVGMPPLAFAIYFTRDPVIVKTLLDRGADVNLQNYAGMSALMESALEENVELVKLLLAANADVNQRSNDGMTGLMIAASSGSPEVVAALIAAGADVNAQNNAGETALSLATKKKRDANVALLKRAGAR